MTWLHLIRSVVPAFAVERHDATGGDAPPPGAVAPVGADPFANDDHRGSADLNEWPMSQRERSLATRAMDGESTANAGLVALCRSPLRAGRIKLRLANERNAAAVLDRVKGF